jgi:hypothetical protein
MWVVHLLSYPKEKANEICFEKKILRIIFGMNRSELAVACR